MLDPRSQVTQAILRGKLTPKPCEKCGTTIRVQAHHPNYYQPLKVRWLCASHHRKLHHFLRKMGRQIKGHTDFYGKDKVAHRRFPHILTTRISRETMKQLRRDAQRQRRSVGALFRIILEDFYEKRGSNGK